MVGSNTDSKGGSTISPQIKIPTFKYDSKTDPFGAVSKVSSNGQNDSGLKLGNGSTITDLKTIDTTKIDPTTFAWGAAASAQEDQSPGYTQKRNDNTAAYLLNKGITSPENILIELNKMPGFSTASEEDKQNTARAMSEQIGSFVKKPDPVQDAWD